MRFSIDQKINTGLSLLLLILGAVGTISYSGKVTVLLAICVLNLSQTSGLIAILPVGEGQAKHPGSVNAMGVSELLCWQATTRKM